MIRTTPKMLLMLACLLPVMPGPGIAQDALALADTVSPRILFLTSGGYWEKPDEASQTSTESVEGGEASTGAQRGYYRLIAIRGEDNRSQLQLQQIALTPDGPEIATSVGIEEINGLGGYITDIRPEDSTGAASQQGFGAYIYLKTDPSIVEPETWALYIDEFGDILVERSSN
jgi:hypothetical protein